MIIGLFIAIVTTVSLFTITVSMRENIDAQLDEFGTNLLIAPRYNEMPLTYGGIVVSNIASEPVKELSMSDVPKMRTIKVKDNLNVISPKLIGPFDLKNKKALLVGIQFENELRIKTWWQYRGKRPLGKEDAVATKNLVKKRAIAATNYKKNEVIAGNNFAKKFNLQPGDSIKIKNNIYKVVSVLKETGSSDDNVMFMDLAEAQNILNKKGKISIIEANAFCLDCPLLRIAGQLQNKLPYAKVSALREAMAEKQNTLSMFSAFSVISSVIVLLIAAFIVLVTTMASVKERTREIGIFRAVGYRKKHIVSIILQETAVISLIGGLTGYFAGFGISKILVPVIAPQAIGFYFNPNVVNPTVMSIAVTGALLLGSTAALYPAIKAARLDPSSALRFI